jgi:predicted RND superfamily exporter protein
LISEDRKWLRIVGRVKDVGASKYLKLCADLNELASKLFSGSEVEVRVTSESYLLHVAMNNILRDVLNSVMWAFIFIGILVGISLRSLRYGLVAIMPNLIPLFTTLGMMGYSGIALRVGTAVVFSVGLGIAVDNTIHCLEEYRRFKERGLSYSEAILKIYQTATPRMIYASVVLILGFFGMSFATFKSVWQMGVLCSFLIAIALSADMLLTLLLVRFTELPVFSEMRGNETRK